MACPAPCHLSADPGTEKKELTTKSRIHEGFHEEDYEVDSCFVAWWWDFFGSTAPICGAW
jgi:hypothetical protein